jgi:nucleotide-binding universal stress UspA family protein
MRTILIPMRGAPGDSTALEAGAALACHFESHLCGVYVRFDAASASLASVSIGGRGMVREWIAQAEFEDARRARHARAQFDQMLLARDIPAGHDPQSRCPSGEWRELTGEFTPTIIDAARFHDVVVCASPAQEDESPDELASILIGAGRPLLLASETAPRNIIHTVVIAWKNTREAAHAVTAAMPILEKARRVVVLSANEGDEEPLECVDCAERLANQLRWHGIKAESRMIVLAGRDAPNAILESATEIHADVLVMGGYGHSRAREFIFGGFTNRVLRGAPMPVFICH